MLSTVSAASRILLSSIVVGELLYGFRYGSRYDENAARLEAFLGKPRVDLLPVVFTTAERFGRIAARLRAEGRPLPANDIWIAAHAMETGADLLSADSHFGAIDGLAWIPFSTSEGESVRERVLRYHAG